MNKKCKRLAWLAGLRFSRGPGLSNSVPCAAWAHPTVSETIRRCMIQHRDNRLLTTARATHNNLMRVGCTIWRLICPIQSRPTSHQSPALHRLAIPFEMLFLQRLGELVSCQILRLSDLRLRLVNSLVFHPCGARLQEVFALCLSFNSLTARPSSVKNRFANEKSMISWMVLLCYNLKDHADTNNPPWWRQ